MRRAFIIGSLLPASVLLVGCEHGAMDARWNKPIPSAPPVSSQAVAAPTLPEVTAAAYRTPQTDRVTEIGQRILGANPDIKLKPAFLVPGSPNPEVFHHGQERIIVSDGLVNQCQTDGELAAVLSMELANMVVERQSRVAAQALAPRREPPPEVPIGPDSMNFGEADQIRKAELAKLGYDRRKPAVPPPLPDPNALAREYLTKAGYAETDLDAASPIIQAAHKSTSLEKQFTATPVGRR